MSQTPHYYLMFNKRILKLEADQSWEKLPQWIKDECLSRQAFNQDQANHRVLMFRDRIYNLDEFIDATRLTPAVAL